MLHSFTPHHGSIIVHLHDSVCCIFHEPLVISICTLIFLIYHIHDHDLWLFVFRICIGDCGSVLNSKWIGQKGLPWKGGNGSEYGGGGGGGIFGGGGGGTNPGVAGGGTKKQINNLNKL